MADRWWPTREPAQTFGPYWLLRTREWRCYPIRRRCSTRNFARSFFLGSMGVAIPGTAFSAISAQARMRELMLPVLLLPLLTPVLIASTEATAALLAEKPELRLDWLGFLAGFDVVFLTALWLFGEYLLEE